MPYRHTQSSYLPLAITVAVFVVVAVALLAGGGSGVWFLVVPALVVVFVGVGASRLTAAVDDATVEAVFAFGWPRRSIPIDEITAARTVRNRWYYGLGVRLIPRGWMYNVYGLDAVELELASGRVFRIGTDEPEALLAAITDAMASRGQA